MTEQIPAPPPPPELPASARNRKHTVLAVALSTVGVLLVVVIVAGFLIHLPYVIISPGSATPLDSQVVQIDGAQTYPDDAGELLFLTVRVSTSDPNVWRVVTAWLDPDRDVQDRNDGAGVPDRRAEPAFNTDLMDQSQNDAKYVALTRLGYAVPANPVQIRVVEVCRDVAGARQARRPATRSSPSTAPTSATRRRSASSSRRTSPATDVTMTYDRNGVTRTASITVGRSAPKARRTCVPCVERRGIDQRAPTCLGVSSQEFVTYQFPIDVKINTQLVGGPSAGLAFTLAIIDDLTPGSLTGGKRVAVTGTIQPDGTVGEVGGVEQKAITARTNGVQLMIVPKAEVKDARNGAGDVRVVGVENIERGARPRCARRVVRQCRHRRRPRRDHEGMTDTSDSFAPRSSRTTPEAIAERSFSQVKRGYAESEVRAYLRMVSSDFAAAASRERELAARVRELEDQLRKPVLPPSDQDLIAALGEETARVLGQARESAIELRNKAEEHARRRRPRGAGDRAGAAHHHAAGGGDRRPARPRTRRATGPRRSSGRPARCASACSPTSTSADRSSSARSANCAAGAGSWSRPTSSWSARSDTPRA